MQRSQPLAFEAFASTRMPELFRYGYALTGDQDAAADLVQEALVRAGLRWPRLARGGNPEGYVRRRMARTSASWTRRVRPAPSPSQRGDAQLQGDDAMWAALASLPPRQRAVLVLRYYENLSDAQIADAVGCSIPAVTSQSARAMAQVRAVLEPKGAREAQ